MSDHPYPYATGFRHVIAAWLVCLAVAATGFAYATVSDASQERTAEAGGLPRIAPTAAAVTSTVCAPPAPSRG